MDVYEEGALRLVKAGPLGDFGNNAYLIQDRDSGEAIIVDAPADGERLLEALGDGRVSRIVVTHRHADHWLSIDALKAITGAPVTCHEADREPYAAKVDATLADGDEIEVGGLRVRVIHTPGHTAGHVSFLVEGHGGVLFVGDAAANMLGRFGKPLLMFTEDMGDVKKSMQKLAALEFDTACFGHGRVLKGKAHLAFRRYVEKIPE